MCTRYSLTKGQAAILALIKAMKGTMRRIIILAAVIALLAISSASCFALEYASVAALPCMNLLNAYGRGLNAEGVERWSSLFDPVAEYISKKDSGFGSTVNITDYVLTECRLNENLKISEAVNNLFDKKRRNRLPEIPIGGATDDPKVHADWDAFDKWIHHLGPRPNFSVVSSPVPTAAGRTQPPSQAKPKTAGCYRDGEIITIQGVATAQSLELANGSMQKVWLLVTDRPVCIVESITGTDTSQRISVSRLQIIGQPPPAGVAIELTGKLSTGNITQWYAESTAIVVNTGRRIEAPQPPAVQSAAPPIDETAMKATAMQARACIRGNILNAYVAGVYGYDQATEYFISHCLSAFVASMRSMGFNDDLAVPAFKILMLQEIAPEAWQKTLDDLKRGSR
jgi:hypothetical protein